MTPDYTSFKKLEQTPNSPIVFEPTKAERTASFMGWVELTKASASILHPKYSMVYWGIKMIGENEPAGDYLRGLPQAIGFLLLAASPVLEAGRFALGGAGIGLGVAGASFEAPRAFAEKIFRKVTDADKLNNPELKRQKLMDAFTKRMRRMINTSSTLSADDKKDLLDSPKILIALSVLALAFASKDQYGNQLLMADNAVLKREQTESLDEEFKDLFSKICALKDRIRRLAQNEPRFSWDILMKCLDDPSQTKSRTKNDQMQQYTELNEKVLELAEDIFEDAGFQASWEISKIQINNNNNL